MIFHLEKLCSTILKARLRKGFSQAYMAHKLGISQKAYSYLESGHSRLDTIKFLKIANYTETHPMFIINKISEGIPTWESGDKKEVAMAIENDKLVAQIAYLNSHNVFLKDTIVKLLEKLKEKKE